ncbi:hypothetical protein P3W66_14975 [Achromobacter denitrificans]|uniref:hypothetical protein n=1 Tax=Achromobacter denitrificans TaxID=32002 RepID=UPI0023E88730|nr:hypothetical protein [Achromobacter denitrificans]MDF3941343.1 hypothetical protein [Achromobacter denitrificans]
MTNQNNAAQAASENPLSDEYVNAVIRQHGYQSPEAASARLYQWIGLYGGENGVTLLIYEAHKALSQLRAPVADEPAAEPVSPWRDIMTAEDSDDLIWLFDRSNNSIDGPRTFCASDVDWYTHWAPCEAPETSRAALASAPVAIPGNTLTGDGSGVALPLAGEAPPTDWQNAMRIAELPEVDEALAVFCNDGTLDNAVGLVQAILDAAPQVSDGVLPAPCHDLRYHDQYRIGWNRCLDACRAALAAQPAEKPATSAPSPAASQHQAMVPGSRGSGNSHTDGGAVYA